MKKMPKLRLDVDQLTVQSFEIANRRQVKGTVRAHDDEVCSDFCTVSQCAPTCGIMPASAESACEAIIQTGACGDTGYVCDSAPCCV